MFMRCFFFQNNENTTEIKEEEKKRNESWEIQVKCSNAQSSYCPLLNAAYTNLPPMLVEWPLFCLFFFLCYFTAVTNASCRETTFAFCYDVHARVYLRWFFLFCVCRIGLADVLLFVQNHIRQLIVVYQWRLSLLEANKRKHLKL